MNNKNYLIIYNRKSDGSESQLIGFKLFDKEEAGKYLKCVKALEEIGEEFEECDLRLSYSMEDFEKFKLSAAELKALSRLFCGEDADKVGIFPDAISNAYDFGLIEEEEEDYDDDEETDEF